MMATAHCWQHLQRPRSAGSCCHVLQLRTAAVSHREHSVIARRHLRCQPARAITCSASSSGGQHPSKAGVQGLASGSYRTAVEQKNASSGTGVFLLLLINLALFFADRVLRLPVVQSLYLTNYAPRWWQFVTCAFCHANWDHLSSNLFMLFVFGRIVEEEEGSFGVWLTYLICSAGASLATFLIEPRSTISMGASGAVFGLYAVAAILKLRFNFKKLVEFLVLGQFVVKQVLQEVVSAQSGGVAIGGMRVGHVAHLGGAVIGVLLVLLLSRLPDMDAKVTAAKQAKGASGAISKPTGER